MVTQPADKRTVLNRALTLRTCHASEVDAELMCRVRDGDVHSYSVLLERNRKPLIHFLHRIVQNEFVAEELAQEVFLRVFRARSTYEPTAKFTTWLFRIGSRVAINCLRDRRYEKHRESLDSEGMQSSYREFPDRKPTIEERLLAGAKALEIRRAIDCLPANQRAAVIMHKYKEFDYSQIALALHCSESAVKSLLFRAYERLRSRLAHFSA
jgi:RNA polymerase sigma-70 factor (ECF subfamily)